MTKNKNIEEKCDHKWIEKVCCALPYRYCPNCMTLETNIDSFRKKIPISHTYHKIIHNNFDSNHIIPNYFNSIIVTDKDIETYGIFNDCLGRQSKKPYNVRCYICGKVGNHNDLSIKKSDWYEEYEDLCSNCYNGKDEKWLKHRYLCFFGLHKLNPILNNPKVCYRCGKKFE